MFRAVTSLVAPPLCALCAEPCDYVDSICGRCERRVSRLRPVRSEAGGLELWSAAPYEGIAREIVAKMKFQQRLTLAEVAAERMVRTIGAGREREVFVAVPPAPARERARGFDVASVLARLVGRECGQAQVCIERDDGPRQVGRGREERRTNPPAIRSLAYAAALPSTDLWLVDDVATTGSTLLACAEVLRELGAVRVRALTFARADQ